MSKFLKVLLIVAIVIIAAMALVACDNKEEQPDILKVVGSTRESLEDSLKSKAGLNKKGQDVKGMIYDIIDFNNNNASDMIYVSYKEVEYKEIEDLNYLCDLLIDDEIYDVIINYKNQDIAGIELSQIESEVEEDLIIIDEDNVE